MNERCLLFRVLDERAPSPSESTEHGPERYVRIETFSSPESARTFRFRRGIKQGDSVWKPRGTDPRGLGACHGFTENKL